MFDVEKHLPGWVGCKLDPERSEFLDFASFEALNRQRMTPARLEEVRELWKAEVHRAEELVEQARRDPLTAIKKRLAQNPRFQSTRFEDDRSADPFLLLIQKDADAPANYSRRISQFYLPWLTVLATDWDELFVKPLGLQRQPDYRKYVLIVLKSHEDYLEHVGSIGSQDLYFARAYYDPELRVAVTFQDAFDVVDDEGNLQAALHEMTHALQDSYTVRGAPESVALREGLAEYFSCADYHKTSVRTLRRFDGTRLIAPTMAFLNPRIRDLVLVPPGELLSIPDYRGYIERSLDRGIQAVLPSRFGPLDMLYLESYLLCHYAMEGDGQKYRKSFQSYVGQVLRGTDKAWLAAFPEGGGDDLAREFDGFVVSETRRMATTAFGEKALAEAGLNAVDTPREEPLDVEALRVSDPDVELRAALAVDRARHGELSEAAHDLEMAPSADTQELAARVAREGARLRQLLQLRDDFLREWPRTRNLVLELEGRRVYGKIQEIGPTSITLQNGQGTCELPLTELTPSIVAEVILDKKLKLGDPSLLAYATALGGGDRWQSLLVGTSSTEELRRDLEDLPRWLAMARAARDLDALADAGIPTDPAAAQVAVEHASWLLRQGALDFVRARADTVRGLARLGFLRLAEEHMEEILHTAVKPRVLADERWELTYEFDSADELQDFSGVSYEPFPGAGTGLSRTDAAPRISQGALLLQGGAFLAHVLEFDAPLELEMESSSDPYQGDSKDTSLRVFLCDDASGSFVMATQMGDLLVLDAATGHQELAPGLGHLVTPGHSYSLRLRHDGGQISVTVDGTAVGPIAAGLRTGGRLLLEPHSDADQRIHRLVIRATPSPAFVTQRKAAWVEEQMQALADTTETLDAR